MNKTPIFLKTLNRLATNPDEATPKPPVKKHGKTFGESRDVREDRGTRQIKASQKPQTQSGGKT
jgi:hypothetical protein